MWKKKSILKPIVQLPSYEITFLKPGCGVLSEQGNVNNTCFHVCVCSITLGRRSRVLSKGIPGPGGAGGGPVAIALEDTAVNEFEDIQTASSPTAQLRNYFPETWLWSLERTG